MIATVRPALASDSATLAAIRAETSEPGGALDEPDASAGVLSEPYTELLRDRAGSIYVAETSGSVVGFLALERKAHNAVVGRNPLKLWQLYVVPKLHGSGVASQLMSVALDHARRHLHDVVWLGVSEHNARAIAFYRKHGFNTLGRHNVGSGGQAHQDVVMSCRVR